MIGYHSNSWASCFIQYKSKPQI